MRPDTGFEILFYCMHDSRDGKPRVTQLGADLGKTLQLSFPYLGMLWLIPSLQASFALQRLCRLTQEHLGTWSSSPFEIAESRK